MNTQTQITAEVLELAVRDFDAANQAYLAAKQARDLALAVKNEAYARHVEARYSAELNR